MSRRIRWITGAVLVLAIFGCGGKETTVDAGEGDCASSVRYEGRFYRWSDVEVAPREARPLGEAGLYCNLSEAAEPDENIEIVAIEGVSPEVALAWRQHSDMVFVRDGLDPLPPEVARLMRAPKCRPSDQPIELAGPWQAIHGVFYEELDLIPPYDVELLVQESSVPRYERAFLTVRIPKTLGRPLTRTDVRESLRRGGSISLTATCWLDGRYVAERVVAEPPD